MDLLNPLRALPRRTSGRFVIVGLVALVVLGAGIWAAFPKPAPAITAAPPHRPSIPILATIGLAGRTTPATAHPGEIVMVTGHALGTAPLERLELWDGSTEVAATSQVGTAPAFHAVWEWHPTSPGEHILFTRAVDAEGRVAQSDPARLTVGGEAVPDVPGQPSGSPAAVGPTGSAPGTAASPTVSLPSPRATASVDGCTATVDVAAQPGAATGFGFLALAPGAATFLPLGTVAASSGMPGRLVVPLPAGDSLLTVTAFNAGAETYGTPVMVHAPQSCDVASGWTGSLRLDQGVLMPAPHADRAYLYVTQDNGTAQRVPEDPAAFVEPSDGTFDFSHDLPALTGEHVHVVAWGWSDGKLASLGTGDWSAPASAPASTDASTNTAEASATWYMGATPAIGLATKLDVLRHAITTGCGLEFCDGQEAVTHDELQRPEAGSSGPDARDFSWSTSLADVTSLVWQVLPYPVGGTPDLAPPFLVDSGTVPVDPGSASGEFSIDFRPYLVAAPLSQTDIGDTAKLSGAVASSVFGSATGGASAATASASPSPPGAGTGSGVAVPGSFDSATADAQLTRGRFLLGFSGRFYVRIIPIADGTPAPPSAMVTLDVVDPPPPLDLGTPAEVPDPGLLNLSASVTLPRSPDPHYARCALVSRITGDFVRNPVVDYPAYRDSQQPLCYQPPDDGWSITDAFDAFVEFVGDVWDAISSGYAWIKEKVVELALDAVPCSAIASDDVCKAIATTALDAALTSFGIPPSLPNFDAVVAASKGELSTFVVQAAGSVPGVQDACGFADAAHAVTSKLDNCDELASDAIDAVVAQVVATRSQTTAQTAGQLPWPGVVYTPDPRGQWQPPSVKFTVTRTTDPYQVAECRMTFSLDSVLDDWTWTELKPNKGPGASITDVSGTVRGSPFLPATATIPQLQPGQSYSGQLWLTRPAEWTESSYAYIYWHYYESILHPDRSWVLLEPGAHLTFHLTSNCAAEYTQTATLTTSGYNP